MKKYLILFFAILTTLTFTACGTNPGAKDHPLPKLTVGLMPDVDSLPFLIAQ